MARKTNKELVLTLAAELGIDVEYGPVGDGFEVALETVGVWNTYGTGIRTEAGIWGAALSSLRDVAERVGEVVADDPASVTMPFTIVDTDTDAEYSGTAITAATPAETMRTTVARSFGISRNSVRIWETDNYREYGFDTRHGHRGTARFTDPAPDPYRPAPVALTHSYI